MREQVKVTAREGEAEFRCPYCHDLLGEEVDDVRFACEGCGTTHHLACLTELGRCTVMGCGRPVDADAFANVERAPATSRLMRLIRQRQRDRVRQFVRRNAQEPGVPAIPPRFAAREGGWGATSYLRGRQGSLWHDSFVRTLLQLLVATLTLAALAGVLLAIMD